SRQARGTAIINLLNISEDEKINSIIPINKNTKEENLVIITKNGIIKKTKLDEFENIRRNGLKAIELKEDDELIAVRKTDGNREIIVVTKKGMAIRFDEKDVREMSRAAMGVKAITLNDGDQVVTMELVEE